jgi:predicted transposase/invertase (TIGR01784 family)
VQHARQEGIQKGEQIGIQKGRKEYSLNVALNLINMNMPIDVIIKATGLSQPEIEELSRNKA